MHTIITRRQLIKNICQSKFPLDLMLSILGIIHDLFKEIKKSSHHVRQ